MMRSKETAQPSKGVQTPLRIAYGRFMQETNSFSSVHTQRADFERTHLKAGEELAQACQPGQWEVEGFLKNLELSGALKSLAKHAQHGAIETLPLLSAWSISGGPLARDFFEEICSEFCQRLEEAGPLDGLILALHGAMGVDGYPDPEAELLRRIREVVGEIPIAITLDLHANLTRAKVQLADIICAYHSNPHYDMARTGAKAADLLLRQLRGEIQPVSTWRSLPILLGGGTGIHLLAPMRAIFQRMKQLEKDPRVLNTNLLMSHPYLDHPEMGWAVEVSTDGDLDLAERLCDELAERCWQVRKQQPPRFLSPEEMLKRVRRARLRRKWGATAVCDTSDVVGAGGTGENTHLLRFLLEQAQDLLSFYPLRDPVAVEQLSQRQLGESVSLQIGGRLQPEVNPGLQVTGHLRDFQHSESFGQVALLDLEHVQVVLTEGYAMPMKPSFYEDMGLSVREADIVVTKNFFHFRLYYASKCLQNLYVKTQGITDFDRLSTIELECPAYPLAELDEWQSSDRYKRQLRQARAQVSLPQKPLKSPYGLLALFVLLLGGHLLYHGGIRPRQYIKKV